MLARRPSPTGSPPKACSASTRRADALETAAGTPVAFTVSALRTADRILRRCGRRLARNRLRWFSIQPITRVLSDKAAVGPGDTVGGEVARFNGIPLVVKAIGGDDPADTYHLPPPVVPYATTMLEAPDGLRIGYVEHPRHYPTPCPRRQPRGFSFPLTEAVNRLALPAPAVWAVGIAGSHDQKAGL